jgi:hypothetical protein
MAATTLTLTGLNAAQIMELGTAITALAATFSDNRAVGTFTVVDTSTASNPWTVTSVDAAGTTRTRVVG